MGCETRLRARLLEHHAGDDDIGHGGVLQQVHLWAQWAKTILACSHA